MEYTDSHMDKVVVLRLVISLFVLITNTAYSDGNSDLHDHEDIWNKANVFLQDRYIGSSQYGSDIDVILKKIDSRVRVRKCDTEIEPFFPYEPSDKKVISIGVQCVKPVSWKLYLQAQVSMIRPVATLNQAVRSGQILSDDMVSTSNIDVLKLRDSAITDITEYLGMKFTRSARAGAPLTRSLLKLPAMIKRGELINILSGEGSVQVAAKGYALSDGFLNENIKVRNAGSSKVIQAQIINESYVRTVQ